MLRRGVGSAALPDVIKGLMPASVRAQCPHLFHRSLLAYEFGVSWMNEEPIRRVVRWAKGQFSERRSYSRRHEECAIQARKGFNIAVFVAGCELSKRKFLTQFSFATGARQSCSASAH
jgi:hypothetical protein